MNKVTVLVIVVLSPAAYYVADRVLQAQQPNSNVQVGIRADVERKLTPVLVATLHERPRAVPKKAIQAWSTLSVNEKIPAISSYPREVPNAVLLKITELRVKRWEVGDHIDFYVPQIDYMLTSKIEERTEHASGIVTLKSYPDETMLNNVLVTLGQKNTFVNLFTPSGEYELVGDLQHGWLVPSAALGATSSGRDVVVSNAEPIYADESTPKELEPRQ
tara:strand:+ start:1676 stop:2329 length:654 start_codon:yes stop_codon:yes gene_type:complete